MPAISGLAEAKPWTNREVTTARRIPRSLVVLGGGAVGVEMAQACSALDSTVTLLEAAERLLTREEPFAGEQLHEALVERGVDVRVGVEAQAVRRDGASVTVNLSDGERVEGNEIVVAVGRHPRTDDLGLETVGLEPGNPVAVDDTLRVPGLPWLYAIGDVNERSLLTHIAKYQAHVACEVIDGGQARATRDGGGARGSCSPIRRSRRSA